jgi:hypothetical protein
MYVLCGLALKVSEWRMFVWRKEKRRCDGWVRTKYGLILSVYILVVC